jgi:preprotein translocase subunit YajC
MDDSLFLFIALAFLGAMLFYSSRKRKKAAEALQAQVVKGAYVMLTSGIFGKVTAVIDNRVELETSPGNKMLVAKGAVASIDQEPKVSNDATKSASKAKPKASSEGTAKSSTKAVDNSPTKKK